MQQPGGNGSGPKLASPEGRVIELAKKWRAAEKAYAASKIVGDGIKEYRARQALRDAIDKLP